MRTRGGKELDGWYLRSQLSSEPYCFTFLVRFIHKNLNEADSILSFSEKTKYFVYDDYSMYLCGTNNSNLFHNLIKNKSLVDDEFLTIYTC